MAKEQHCALTAEFVNGEISLWEQGGGSAYDGDVTLIAAPDGSIPTGAKIPRKREEKGKHALVPVHPKYIVVQTHQYRGEFTHRIYEVFRTHWGPEIINVQLQKLNSYENGAWEKPLEDRLKAVVAAAEAKAMDYHTRKVYYASK